MVGLLYRIPVYMCPFFMANMESQLQHLVNKADALLGPSIGAATIGLFLPVLKPSSSSPPGWKTNWDKGVSAFGVLGLIFSLYFWQMLVAYNLGGGMDQWVPDIDFWSLGQSASVAILIYAAAVFLAEVKAAVEK